MARKGERTRQRLLDTALELFAAHGYEATTMRDIAREAGRSPGLAYRYFRHKEDFVLALYERLAGELEAYEIPTGTVAERFRAVTLHKVALVRPHRRTLSVLAAALIDRESPLGVTAPETASIRARGLAVYARVVVGAEPPGEPSLGPLLYALHLQILLLVLLERSDGGAEAAVELVAELLGLAGAFPGAGAMVEARMAPVLEALFGAPIRSASPSG